MSPAAKSASDYGTHRPRKTAEFLDENLLLLSLEFVEIGQDNKPLPYGPFYVVHACIDSTGEMIEFISHNKHLFTFFAAVKEEGEFPVKFRITQHGKAYGVGDWQ